MIKQKFSFSTDKPVLNQLLDSLGLTHAEFAKQIGITYRQLRKYRTGERDFRLSTSQIKVINDFLTELDITWKDLPDNWILDTTYITEHNESKRVAETSEEYQIGCDTQCAI